jgi:hypothetical protein
MSIKIFKIFSVSYTPEAPLTKGRDEWDCGGEGKWGLEGRKGEGGKGRNSGPPKI